MSDRLPVQIDPVAAADRGRVFDGRVPVRAFERLGHWLQSREGELDVSLRFGRDAADRRVVAVAIRGALELACERCLASYVMPVDLASELVLVESEAEAKGLPENVEALIVGDMRLMHAVDLIEDDLILALPATPRCERDACAAAMPLLDGDDAGSGEASRQRPFAGLKMDS